MTTGGHINGHNVTMMPPDGADDVSPIRAFRNEHCCVTAWDLDDESLAEIIRTRRVYLTVLMGGGMPPVFVGTESEVRDLVANYGNTFPKQGGES